MLIPFTVALPSTATKKADFRYLDPRSTEGAQSLLGFDSLHLLDSTRKPST